MTTQPETTRRSLGIPKPILRRLARSEKALELLRWGSQLLDAVWWDATLVDHAEHEAARQKRALEEFEAAKAEFADLMEFEKAERLSDLLVSRARRSGAVGTA